MPDLQRLYDFLGRTQEHLKAALDAGDQQAVTTYEQMLDRANAVGERVLNGGVVSGPQPITVSPPQEQPQQAAPQAQSAQGQLPSTQGTFTPPGQSLVDLRNLNQSGNSLKVDLEQEAGPGASPFSKPQGNIIDRMTQRYPSPSMSGGSSSAPSPTASAPAGQDMVSQWMTDALPTDWSGKSAPSPQGGAVSGFLSGAATGLKTAMSPEKAGLASMVLGSPQEAGKFSSTPDSTIKANWEAENKQYPGKLEAVSPFIVPEDDEAARVRDFNVYKENPSLQERLDLIAKAKASADDPFEKEFLKRVEREIGQKPKFFTFENIAMLLLMGAPRAYAHHKAQLEQYQSGRRGIAKEMRSEAAADRKLAFQTSRQSVDRELEMKKAAFALLPKAVAAAQKPFLVEAERASAELDTLLRNPAQDQNSPIINQLRNKIKAALEAADEVTKSNYYDRNILK